MNMIFFYHYSRSIETPVTLKALMFKSLKFQPVLFEITASLKENLPQIMYCNVNNKYVPGHTSVSRIDWSIWSRISKSVRGSLSIRIWVRLRSHQVMTYQYDYSNKMCKQSVRDASHHTNSLYHILLFGGWENCGMPAVFLLTKEEVTTKNSKNRKRVASWQQCFFHKLHNRSKICSPSMF